MIQPLFQHVHYRWLSQWLIHIFRGAKTAMTLALRSPGLVGALISVDNAPIDAALKSDFGNYIQGMRKIEEAQVKRQNEADDILKEYEEVSEPIVTFTYAHIHISKDMLLCASSAVLHYTNVSAISGTTHPPIFTHESHPRPRLYLS